MVRAKINHQVDYTACALDELHSFFESRTGKKSTSQSVSYLAGKLKALDKAATFRFMDIPPELRLAVYAELIYQRGPGKTAQILRTSKGFYSEAEPEFHRDGSMLIRLATATRKRNSRIIYSVGSYSTELWNPHCTGAVEVLWPLYEELVAFVTSVRHITVELDCDFRSDPHSSKFMAALSTIAHYLFALVAATRTCEIETLVVRVKHWSAGQEHHLWPLCRVKSTVSFSIDGVPAGIKKYIFSRRIAEDPKQDSISKGRELLARIDGMTNLLAVLNDPKASAKIRTIRAKALKAMTWCVWDDGDRYFMHQLGEVEIDINRPGMQRLLQKAEKVEKAGEKQDEQ